MTNEIKSKGKKFGPCSEDCGHIKCQELREKARRICPLCKKTIGYDTPYIEYEGKIFHAKCLCR